MRMKNQSKMTRSRDRTRYLLNFPTIDDYTRGLSLLLKDGPVDCLAYGNYTMTAFATQAQTQKLDKAGIKWEYVKLGS